jgi:hypothetical protein
MPLLLLRWIAPCCPRLTSCLTPPLLLLPDGAMGNVGVLPIARPASCSSFPDQPLCRLRLAEEEPLFWRELDRRPPDSLEDLPGTHSLSVQ